MKITIKKSDVYVFFLTVWSFLNVICNLTTIDGMLLNICGILLSVIWMMIRLFIIVKITTELEINDLKICLLLLFAIVSDYVSGGATITTAIWFICGAKNINIDKIVKPVFFAHLIGVSCIVCMALSGAIENTVYTRGTGEIRYSMGFFHPNTFAGHMIFLTSLYLMIRNLKNRIRCIDCMLIALCTVWTYKITNSGTGLILMGTLCALGLLICFSNIKFVKRINEFFLDKLKYLIVFMPIFVLWLTLVFDNKSTQFKGTLLSRVSQAAIYFKYYTPNILGHSLELNYTLDYNNLFTLDNAYIFLLLQSGIVLFGLFIIGQILLAKKVAKEKRYLLLGILTVYAIYGFTETMYIRFLFNFTLLYMAEIVWPQNACIKEGYIDK